MSDPVIGATVQVLLQTVLSLATDNIGLVFGLKKDVESLRRSVAMIQAVLADSEKKQYQHESVKQWLQNLQEVAYEADQVFDALNYQLLKRRMETAPENPRKVKVFFYFSSLPAGFRWKMARKVRDINLKLKSINEEAIGFGLQSQLVASGSSSEVTLINRETDSVVGRNVVGRRDDASKIVHKLLSPSVDDVSFIPITGMGGLGKTTLAKLVYNDAQIGEYFHKKIWVCVSDNFDVTRVLKLILESLTGTVAMVSRDAIVQGIKRELDGKRYILVLDDVWCQNPALWDEFLCSLVGICTVKGNWGLVTTRLLSVASMVTTNPPFPLEKLSDDGCWTILKEKASPSGEVPEELDAIKVEIIGACQGLPLAASVIGGLLRIKPRHQWLSIVRNEISNLTGNVQQVLRLSFDHLPSASIKKCFAYCSMFEKDSGMEKDMLIQLWMAEGFLQPDHVNKLDMEVIGSRYFDVLVKSSLIEEVTVGGFVDCRMHDLVHDLAQTVSESETICAEQAARNENCRVRHVVLESLSENILSMLRERSSSLRTIFVKCDISNDLVLNFKCLHVLKLSGSSSCEQLLDSVSKLIHLRYFDFDLSYTGVDALPESLCKLYNLQTLRLEKCRKLRKLPEGMSNLVSLRHLHFYHSDAEFETPPEFKMPPRMRKLTCLQTLEFFNVGEDDGWKIEEIGWLTKLGGSLIIGNLEKVNGKEEALLAKLSWKSKLVELIFIWRDRNVNNNNTNDEDVLEGLEPHPNLQKLSVSFFTGSRFPSWITRLNNLANLRLSNCNGCYEIPALGQLPLLEYLSLTRMNSIRRIGIAFYDTEGNCRRESFPALRHLELYDLLNLVDWMEAEKKKLESGEEAVLQVFPRLEKLLLRNCPQLSSIPSHFPCLKELRLWKTGSNSELMLSSICNKLNTLTRLCVINTKSLTCVPDLVFINNSKTLKSLYFNACINLTHISRFSLSTCENLEDLGTFSCPNLKSVFISSGHQLPSSLRTFQITESIELRSLPDELLRSCTSLQKLEVSNCPNLVFFPVDLQYLPSLPSLDLLTNPKLITLPKGFSNCSSLRSLTFALVSDSVEIDWPDLSSSSVRKLKLKGRPDSVSLPNQLRCLTSITELSLSDFGSLESLPDWLENLVSLQKLILAYCSKLTHLPSAEAMRCLTNLRALEISRCPILKERCTPGNPEWSKISHISRIDIDYRRIK